MNTTNLISKIDSAIKQDAALNNSVFEKHYNTAIATMQGTYGNDFDKLTVLESAFAEFNNLVNNKTLNECLCSIQQAKQSILESDINYIINQKASKFSVVESIGNLIKDEEIKSDTEITNQLTAIANAASSALRQVAFIPACQHLFANAPKYKALTEANQVMTDYLNKNFAEIVCIEARDFMCQSAYPSIFAKQISVLEDAIKEGKYVIEALDLAIEKVGHNDYTKNLITAIREHNKNYYNVGNDFGDGNANVAVDNYIGTFISESESNIHIVHIAPNFFIKAESLNYGKKVCEGLYVADALTMQLNNPKAYNSATLFESIGFTKDGKSLKADNKNTYLELNECNEFSINGKVVKDMKDFYAINAMLKESAQTKDLLMAVVNNLPNVNATNDIKTIRNKNTGKYVTIIKENAGYLLQDMKGAIKMLSPLKLVDYIKEEFSYDISSAFTIELNNKKHKLAKIDEARKEKHEVVALLETAIQEMKDALTLNSQVEVKETVNEHIAEYEMALSQVKDEITILNEEFDSTMKNEDTESDEGQATEMTTGDGDTSDGAMDNEGMNENVDANLVISKMIEEGKLPSDMTDDIKAAIVTFINMGVSEDKLLGGIKTMLTDKENEEAQEGKSVNENDGVTDAFMITLKNASQQQLEAKAKEIANEIKIGDKDTDKSLLFIKLVLLGQAIDKSKPVTAEELQKKYLNDTEPITESTIFGDASTVQFGNPKSNLLNAMQQSAVARQQMKDAGNEAKVAYRDYKETLQQIIDKYAPIIDAIKELTSDTAKKITGIVNEGNDEFAEFGMDLIENMDKEQLKALKADLDSYISGGGDVKGAEMLLGKIESKIGSDIDGETKTDGGESSTKQGLDSGLSSGLMESYSNFPKTIAKYKSLNFSDDTIAKNIDNLYVATCKKFNCSLCESYVDDIIADNLNSSPETSPISQDYNKYDSFKQFFTKEGGEGEGSKLEQVVAKLKEDGVTFEEAKVMALLTSMFDAKSDLPVEEAAEIVSKLFGQGDKHEANETKEQEAKEKAEESEGVEPEHAEEEAKKAQE